MLTQYTTLPQYKHHIASQSSMLSSRLATQGSIASGRATAQVLKSFGATPLRSTCIVQHIHLTPASHRHFSSSESPKGQKFFEKKETNLVRRTPAAWAHPGMHYWLCLLSGTDTAVRCQRRASECSRRCSPRSTNGIGQSCSDCHKDSTTGPRPGNWLQA